MKKTYDVIVIGGGAAGMMAASIAGAQGASVLLLEKNDTLGKKLLISGGGRCNVTNGELDTRTLLAKFNSKTQKSDQFLFSAFAQFAVEDTLDFFHTRNMQTKEENDKRIFPVSNSSQSVFDVLVNEMKKTHVEMRSHAEVKKLLKKDGQITGIELSNKEILTAEAYIVATGGKSHPETGSTGDGFVWLKDLGHTVSETDSALVPLSIKNEWVKELAGITLTDIKITVLQNDNKYDVKKGKLLFTHVGVTGPTILNMSRDIGELLRYGSVELSLDLMPTYDYGTLDTHILEIFAMHSNKKIKNVVSEIVPTALAKIILERASINPEAPCNGITKLERPRLVHTLKTFTLEVKGLLGLSKAVVTSGGVDLKEVDFRTMQSRKYPNLYLIGDILNISRPSGGYSLQLCWTTGYVAGLHAAKNNKE